MATRQEMAMNAEVGKNNNSIVHNILYRLHFVFLYILLYSAFRNNWWFMDEPTELEASVMRGLAIGFFLWFFGINFFFIHKKKKGRMGTTAFFFWDFISLFFSNIFFF